MNSYRTRLVSRTRSLRTSEHLMNAAGAAESCCLLQRVFYLCAVKKRSCCNKEINSSPQEAETVLSWKLLLLPPQVSRRAGEQVSSSMFSMQGCSLDRCVDSFNTSDLVKVTRTSAASRRKRRKRSSKLWKLHSNNERNSTKTVKKICKNNKDNRHCKF